MAFPLDETDALRKFWEDMGAELVDYHCPACDAERQCPKSASLISVSKLRCACCGTDYYRSVSLKHEVLAWYAGEGDAA